MLWFGFSWGFVVARAYQPFSEYSHRLISSQAQFVTSWNVQIQLSASDPLQQHPCYHHTDLTVVKNCLDIWSRDHMIMCHIENLSIAESQISCVCADSCFFVPIKKIPVRQKMIPNRFSRNWEFDYHMMKMRVKYRNSYQWSGNCCIHTRKATDLIFKNQYQLRSL